MVTRTETREAMERMRDFDATDAAEGYVARDEDGRVFFYRRKPVRGAGGRWRVQDGDSATCLGTGVFPSVRMTDGEPLAVKIVPR